MGECPHLDLSLGKKWGICVIIFLTSSQKKEKKRKKERMSTSKFLNKDKEFFGTSLLIENF